MESKDQVHLGTQLLLNFNKEKIFKYLCKLALTTIFRPAASNMGLLRISARPHDTIWHTAIRYHQWICFFVLRCSHSHLWEQI